MAAYLWLPVRIGWREDDDLRLGCPDGRPKLDWITRFAHYCHIRLSLNEMSDHRREHAWPDRQQHFNLVHGGLLLRKSMREVSARREETSGFKKGLGAGKVPVLAQRKS
jgi:hypothetical protein